jgi:hypothetical protein
VLDFLMGHEIADFSSVYRSAFAQIVSRSQSMRKSNTSICAHFRSKGESFCLSSRVFCFWMKEMNPRHLNLQFLNVRLDLMVPFQNTSMSLVHL